MIGSGNRPKIKIKQNGYTVLFVNMQPIFSDLTNAIVRRKSDQSTNDYSKHKDVRVQVCNKCDKKLLQVFPA